MPCKKTRAHRRRHWACIAACIAALPFGLAGAAEPDAEASPGARVEAFIAPAVIGTLSLPTTAAGRLAVVILAHDALGPDPRGERYAAQLTGAGIAVLDLLSPEEPAQRLAQVAAALADDPRFDAGRIGVLGFGAGGALAVTVAAPFAARVALYPGCAALAAGIGQAPASPLLLLHGTADPANPAADCVAATLALARRGALVRRIEYVGAGYAWDHPAFGRENRMLLPAPGGAARVAAMPWPELADLSAAQVAGFFARALDGAGR